MTPEEIQKMTIEEYAEYRKTRVFVPAWQEDAMRRTQVPKMTDEEFEKLMKEIEPSPESVMALAKKLQEDMEVVKEERERQFLRDELKRKQQG